MTLELTTEQRDYIAEYIRSGTRSGPLFAPWPGEMLARAKVAHTALRSALVAEVRRREGHVKLPVAPHADELRAMTRKRVDAMVRGFFPRIEQEAVLSLLERSVVFLTSDSIERILHEESFGSSAWTLANLYLTSVGAESLGDGTERLLGLSQETTCFVTARYLQGRGRFDDYLVHEAAHVFHNWKREYAGMPYTRTKEWLLPVDFSMREQFAFACEVYSRIVEQAKAQQDRLALFAEYSSNPFAGDDDVHVHLDILREAVVARNGWRRILERCKASAGG
ncbi:MAG: hypothetical protein QM784_29415 [Polyangiaceae bacterium]